MNQTKKNRCAAMLLAALLAMPVGALAMETAPLSLQPQSEVQTAQDAGQLKLSELSRSLRCVYVGTSWMQQARVSGLPLNLRLYTPAGEAIVFKQSLCDASTGGTDVCLVMRASTREGAIIMQLDQPAIDVLNRVGVTELIITDADLYVRQTYLVSELAAVREALALREGEQLCVSGEDEAVTVVSESGVRRQINP